MLEISATQFYYISAVTVVIFSIFVVFWAILSKIKSRKLEETRKIKKFSPIRSTASMHNTLEAVKKMATKRIKNQFSIITKVLAFIILTSWLVFLAFPYIGDIPLAFLSIIGTIGAAIIGIAARPVVENIISGIVISLSGQIRLGDIILIDDKYGTVEDITFTNTVIKLWDWRRQVLPNSLMIKKDYINYSLKDNYIWTSVEFWVAADSDMNKVEDITKKVLRKSKYSMDEEEVNFWISEMDKDGIKCWAAAWANSPTNSWYLKSEGKKDLIKAFRKNKIKNYKIDHVKLRK